LHYLFHLKQGVNVVSQEVVDKMKLKTIDHPQPYKAVMAQKEGVL